jgi:hypothetical protein
LSIRSGVSEVIFAFCTCVVDIPASSLPVRVDP